MIIFVAAVSLLVSVVQRGNCGEVCQTPACISTAARVAESMHVGPCDDFYEFACRGWILKNPIAPNEQAISTMKLIEKQIQMKLHEILDAPDNAKDGKPIKLARALYRTCMDVGGINKLGLKPLHNILTKIGLPHAPPSDEEAKNLDIPKIAGLASRLAGTSIFFSIIINQNLTDSTRYQLVITQKSPGYNDFDVYLLQPKRFEEMLRGQRNYAKRLFATGGGGNKSEEYATELMQFITKLAKIMGTRLERGSGNYNRSVATIDKIQEITDPHGDTWNWTNYLKGVVEQSDIIVDPKTDTVFLYDVSYSTNLVTLLKETPRGIIARYLWWEIIFIYWDEVYNSLSISPRSEVCMNVVNQRFEPILTAAYVDKHFDVQYKKKAMEMWADLNSTLDGMIDELDWMDAETKAHAHVKLHAVRFGIGYPEWITNPEELNKYYEPFEVFEGRLFDTYMQYQLIFGKRLVNSWKYMPDKKPWIIAGTSVNAMYTPNLNEVAITAGLLHLPFYGNGVESLNYGALGAVTGSQLVQVIDNIGGETDENGNLRRWWSEKTLNTYLEKIGCIIKQYTDLSITHDGNRFKLNELQFRQGSIANIAGLKIAFRAYKKFKATNEHQQVLPALEKYTDEQLFFLGFAQSFCGSETAAGLNAFIQANLNPPNHYRVVGTLRNSEEFAKAWNCSRNTPMNPNKTCPTVW